MQTIANGFTTTSQTRAVHLPDVTVAEARARLHRALAKEGLFIVKDLDLAELLNRRLDDTIDPYFVVEGCHPMLARRALAIAWDGGLVASVKFAVWKEGTGSTIATLVPARLTAALDRPHLGEVAEQLDQRLDAVFEQLLATNQDEPLPLDASEELDLDESERRVLADATRRHIQELSEEAARTDSRPLQHELSQTITRLETVARKLGVAPSAPR